MTMVNKYIFLLITKWRDGNVLQQHTQNILFLQLFGNGHIAKDHSDSERGNPLPSLHGLLFTIRSGQVRVFNVHNQSKLS